VHHVCARSLGKPAEGGVAAALRDPDHTSADATVEVRRSGDLSAGGGAFDFERVTFAHPEFLGRVGMKLDGGRPCTVSDVIGSGDARVDLDADLRIRSEAEPLRGESEEVLELRR
jgi:hypothetical protein